MFTWVRPGAIPVLERNRRLAGTERMPPPLQHQGGQVVKVVSRGQSMSASGSNDTPGIQASGLSVK
jgi:hypothetical protein